jgi:RimJ/RimL family protein N-acetyltransferase
MFRIEPGQEKHIESIYRAYDVVAREGLYFAETEAIPLDHFRQWMDVAIQLNCPQVVALSREDVIGWSIAHRADEPFTRHCCTLFMGLLPQWRGRGIGRRLLTATLNEAWKNALTRIQLDVYADNSNAIRLYRQAGFIEEGVRQCAHIVDGRYRDVVNMAILAPASEACEPCPETATA